MAATEVAPPGIFPAPPGVTPNYYNPATHSLGLEAVIGIFLALSTIFLIIRLYTKAFIIRIFGLEDFLVVLGWMCTVGFMSMFLALSRQKGTRHIYDMYHPQYDEWVKLDTAANLLAVPAVSLPKMAILLFYLRLNPTRNFRYATFAVLFMTVAYFISFTLAQLFACHPVKKLWLPFIEGKCLNAAPLYLAIPIVNMVIDIFCLLLPIPMLIKLHVNIRTKLILATIFAISGCTVVVSAARVWAIKTLLASDDFSWDAAPSSVINVIENNMTVVCSCIMVLRPFLRRHFPFLLGSTKGRPTEESPANGLNFDGPSGPKSKSGYRTKVSSGIKSGSKGTGKKSFFSGLGASSTLVNGDDDDMESLSKELRVLAPHVKLDGSGAAPERREGPWQNQHENAQSAESIGVARGGERDAYTRKGELENGIVKTVSLDVRSRDQF